MTRASHHISTLSPANALASLATLQRLPASTRKRFGRAVPVVAAFLFGTSVLAAAPARALGPAGAAGLARVATTVPTLPEVLVTPSGPCPPEMAHVGRSCVDKWEASLVEIDESGREMPHSPFEAPNGKRVRAVSRANVTPQAHISMNEAKRACEASHKRLCKAPEWKKACKGPESTQYPYGNKRVANACVDTQRVSPMHRLHNGEHSSQTMNDARANQIPGTLERTGEAAACTNGYDVHDMVGNVHEWTDDGSFRGGYYLDTEINGEGCDYRTTAHAAWYYDYSTGFRCCSDADEN